MTPDNPLAPRVSGRHHELWPVGQVVSPLRERASATHQGNEGAADARLVLDEALAPAVRDLGVGDDIFVLTWLDRAVAFRW